MSLSGAAALNTDERHHPLNMTTGPVEVSQGVLDAQRSIMTSPHIGDFWALHDETLARLQRILETKGTVLSVPGSIRAGLSIALDNFVDQSTRVLAISNGYWGELIAQMCRERGADVIELDLPALLPIDPEIVRRAIKEAGRLDLVTVVHVETNVGVVNPIDQIGAIVSETDALFFVDTACSAGAMPIGTDRIGIDVGVTGSHKCLAGLPGLAVFSLSDKAWRRLRGGSKESGFFNFEAIKTQTLDRPQPPPYTQPTGLFAALHQALGEIEAVGLATWFELHRNAAEEFRSEIRNLGMAMLPDLAGGKVAIRSRETYSDTVLAVAYPDNVDDERFRTHLAIDHGVFIIGNLGDWTARSFRVGLMSPPQLAPHNLKRTLEAFRQTLAKSSAC